ncbi:MAG: hydrogenase maturation protease [Bdellovibrio sp.]|nr:hydrogenase maturation protease [Bdellovibrio sp.]
MNDINDLLIQAIGNPARGDDGLGPRFIEELSKRAMLATHTQWDYQLSIEHAELFSKYKRVLIVDASKSGNGPFQFSTVLAGQNTYISSHILLPQNILALTQLLYHAYPQVYLLAIKGEIFNLSENLSKVAEFNLYETMRFVQTTFNL